MFIALNEIIFSKVDRIVSLGNSDARFRFRKQQRSFSRGEELQQRRWLRRPTAAAGKEEQSLFSPAAAALVATLCFLCSSTFAPTEEHGKSNNSKASSSPVKELFKPAEWNCGGETLKGKWNISRQEQTTSVN